MANRTPRLIRRRLFGIFIVSILICVALHVRLFSDHMNLSLFTDASKFRYNEFLIKSEWTSSSQITTRECMPNVFPGYEELSVHELQDFPVPNVVHYVWCHNRTLAFENYLSILSAWKILRPDGIEVHYENEIKYDNDNYNMWLQELKSTIPGLVFKHMPPNWDGQEQGCGPHFGIAVLHDRGGIFLSESVILLESSIRHYRKHNFSFALNKHADISFVFSVSKEKKLKTLAQLTKSGDLSINSFENTTMCEVVSSKKLSVTNEDNECTEVSDIFPVDIMVSKTKLARVARKLFYGDDSVVETRPVLPGKIPKIVHLVWYKKKEMTFMMYLSLRSALTILNAEKVFIYGDKLLYGEYFDKIMRDPRVKLIYREMPRYIYGNDVLYTQHRSDIIRADVLLKYGGIYMDWDVLWLKPIDDLINQGYDAIVNFDHNSRRPYPDAINLGVFLAKPNSHFVKYWQDSLLHYKSRDFLHNALELPYKTYEKYPHYVKIERHLQVMCYLLRCHPTFRNDYKNIDKQQYFDWQNDTYSIHFTHPDPPSLASERKLNQSHDRFSDMGRYILSHKYDYN